jgi:hypothetical protein
MEAEKTCTSSFSQTIYPLCHHLYPEKCPLDAVLQVWPRRHDRSIVTASNALEAIPRLLEYAQHYGLSMMEMECVSLIFRATLPNAPYDAVGAGSSLVDGTSDMYRRILRCMIPQTKVCISDCILSRLVSSPLDDTGRICTLQWIRLAWESHALSIPARRLLAGSLYDVIVWHALSTNPCRKDAVRLLVLISIPSNVTVSRLRRLRSRLDESTVPTAWIVLWQHYTKLNPHNAEQVPLSHALPKVAPTWSDDGIDPKWRRDFATFLYHGSIQQNTTQPLHAQLEQRLVPLPTNLLSKEALQRYWLDPADQERWEFLFAHWWHQEWYSARYPSATSNNTTHSFTAARNQHRHALVTQLADHLVMYMAEMPLVIERVVLQDILPAWNGDEVMTEPLCHVLLPRLMLSHKSWNDWRLQVLNMVATRLFYGTPRIVYSMVTGFLAPLVQRYDTVLSTRIHHASLEHGHFDDNDIHVTILQSLLRWVDTTLCKLCLVQTPHVVHIAILDFYSVASRCRSMEPIPLPSAPLVYSIVVLGSIDSIERLCSLVLQCPEARLAEGQKYLQDVSRLLWSDPSWQALDVAWGNLYQRLSSDLQTTLGQIARTDLNVPMSFTIIHGAAFAGVASEFLAMHHEIHSVDKIRGTYKEAYLQHLRSRGLSSIVALLLLHRLHPNHKNNTNKRARHAKSLRLKR